MAPKFGLVRLLVDERVVAGPFAEDRREFFETVDRELALKRLAHVELKQLGAVITHVVEEAYLQEVNVVRPVALGRGFAVALGDTAEAIADAGAGHAS